MQLEPKKITLTFKLEKYEQQNYRYDFDVDAFKHNSFILPYLDVFTRSKTSH